MRNPVKNLAEQSIAYMIHLEKYRENFANGNQPTLSRWKKKMTVAAAFSFCGSYYLGNAIFLSRTARSGSI